MRTSPCPSCHRPPLYYPGCDTFGCPSCDRWTETSHGHGGACADGCDAGFATAPERPSLYEGPTDDVLGRGGA